MHKVFTDLVDVQRRAVRDFSTRDVFGTKIAGRWRWITYGEFGERVDDVRSGLAQLGVGKGDCVAMIAGNRVEWAVSAYATYGLGALFTPMYEHQHEREWRYIIEDSDAKVLIVSSPEIYRTTSPWIGEVGQLEHVRCIDVGSADADSFAGLRASGAGKPCEVADIDPSDAAGLIYTSGTTGNPKGVCLSHGNIASNINAIHTWMPVGRTDLSVSFLPWAHSFGQVCELHMMLSAGAAVAFAESIPKLAENIAECRPTALFAVPRVFNKIYDGVLKKVRATGGTRQKLFEAALNNARARADLEQHGRTSVAVDVKHALFDRIVFSKVRARFGGRLTYAFSGGAALSTEVASFMDCLGITIYEGYGLTETSPIATANRPGERKVGSVGRPIPGVELRIDLEALDDEGARPGEGEILIRGPNIMQGYHKLPEQTAEVMTDGWFRSGDRGYLDEDGFLWITGRIKEQYKLENGKYVVPAPLEQVLQLSPIIGQAFVYGDNRPHNVALIYPDPEASPRPDERALMAAVDRYSYDMKGYEKPKRVAIIDEELSVDNGMLTPKMSIRRPQVVQRYAALLDSLYES